VYSICDGWNYGTKLTSLRLQIYSNEAYIIVFQYLNIQAFVRGEFIF